MLTTFSQQRRRATDQGVKYVGLDVHKETIAVAVADDIWGQSEMTRLPCGNWGSDWQSGKGAAL
jgi:hypothetical protein